MKRILLTLTILAAVLTVAAQAVANGPVTDCQTVANGPVTDRQTVVSGRVTDRQSGRPLAHVSIAAEGSGAHTVTNDEGRFTLKTVRRPAYLLVSHIGYKTRRYVLDEGPATGLTIAMTASTIQLQEIVVSTDDALSVVKAAMSRIPHNYAQEAELVRCFYRETVRKGGRFISVAEAVADMYKSDYSHGPELDAVAILKGRRLMSMKARDTLGVKIQGGPVMPLMCDVAKNSEYLLNAETQNYYLYRMEPPTKVADRLHYVVRMTPKPITLMPLMGGLLYIDQETLAITRAELELDVSDWRRASDYMLVRKPAGLRFRPRELSVVVVYETDAEGVTRMSYMRNEMRFMCDWKRRLFASPYTTVSEMVVTDRLRQGREARRPRGRSSFGIRERFYDKVEYFDDPDFWADYNIIEPTESLEHAIDRLKKKVRR